MRIRGVEIRNWACIESLSLVDLQDGVIVMHGPNRTGKSSLVQAIRSCLFDHFHDSQASTLLAAIPQKTKAVPEVTVEFDQAGQRYRIRKNFARTKEGQTTLEQQHAGVWSVLVRGKDASKRVRELIDVESSEAGIFQMLWLGQRDFHLPLPRDIDPSLAKALEAVLGTLITGRDIDFKDRLDKACERWFTVKTLKDRKDSPVTKQAGDLDQARIQLDEINRKWADAEESLRQYDEAVARQPGLQRTLDEADAELQAVQKQCEGVRQRKAQFDLAVKNRDQCERLLNQAAQREKEFDDATRQLETATRLLDDLQFEMRTAEENRVRAEDASAVAAQSAEVTERDLVNHQYNRAALEDRQRLVNNRLEQQSLEEKIRQAEELDRRRQELEQKLVGAPVLSEKEIHELRQIRERVAGLRASLEAGEIHISLFAKEAAQLQITTDGAPAESTLLAESQERRWLIRQRAEIEVDERLIVRIGRGKEDQNVETLARELAEREQTLRESLTVAQVDPDDPTAIDQLVARRLHHVEFTQQLRNVRENLGIAAADGIPSLHGQLQQKRDEQQAVLARRPELNGWSPDQIEMDGLRSAFDQDEEKLKTAAQSARQNLERSTQAVRAAMDAEQSLRTRIAGQSVQVQSLKDRLSYGERTPLVLEREQATARLVEARRKVEESTLTDAEQSLETEFQRVRSACAIRAQRVRDNDDLLLRLRTQLAGTEGLHQKRIQAEQVFHDRTRELERETLYGQAHKHLKGLFEKIRQEQVRRTVGPINDRVMLWAKQLGLTDYAELSFDGQLLPGGLIPGHAADAEAVELARESYGTLEQLSLLIRLAVGGLLARSEPAVAILDDPLAHADPGKHRKMLDLLARAAAGEPHGPHPTGPLQLIILTCHADRFDYLDGAQQIDLARLIQRGG